MKNSPATSRSQKARRRQLTARPPVSTQSNPPAPFHTMIQRAQQSPQTLFSQEVLTLQRSIGNRAMNRLLRSQGKDAVGSQTMTAEGGIVDQGVEDSIHLAKGSGRKMEQRLQRHMEAGLGTSFGDVQIHTDQRADTLNRSLDARAFTTGSDIFFRQGEYQPTSRDGQQLIAHELTHVVQQQGGNQSGVQRIQRWPWSKKNKKQKNSSTEPKTTNDLLSEFSQSESTSYDKTPESTSPWLQPRQHRLTIDEGGLEDMLGGQNFAPETQLVDDAVPTTNGETQEETGAPKRKSNKSRYHTLLSKFMKGSKKETDHEKLGRAQLSAGSINHAVPDYANPGLMGEPDQYTVTVAVAQEHSDWWETVKKIKAVGLRKIFQSPRKFFRKIKGGDAEEYLLEKVLKQQEKLPQGQKAREKAIEEASDKFHDVGHTWVRFSKRVGGHMQELYSYGFWPRKIFGRGGYSMEKYVPGQVRHPDTEHEKDDQKRYFDVDVPAPKFNQALNLAQSHYESPPNYHLLDYNCTKFAREILKAAGGSFPGKGVFPAFAFSPGQLFKQLGDLQGDPTKLKQGEGVRDQDSPEDLEIVKQVQQEQKTRARTASNEEHGLTPKDPADYPEGIYDNPLAQGAKLTGAEDIGGPAEEAIEIYPFETDNELTVKDSKTLKYGRGTLKYRGEGKQGDFTDQTIYVDLDQVINPGTRPSHTLEGDVIDYDTHTTQDTTQQEDTRGALPDLLTSESILHEMRLENWDDLQRLGVDPSVLDGLNEEQVANLAKLIYTTPAFLARVIARLNGRTVSPPPITNPPSSQHRPSHGPESLSLPPTSNTQPESSQSESSQSVFSTSSSVAPQLLGTARAVWNRSEDTLPVQNDSHEDSYDDSYDDDSDDDDYIELPEQINEAVISMIRYDEWDTIFDIMGISRSVFKGLDEDQIEFLAEEAKKTPEALALTIQKL